MAERLCSLRKSGGGSDILGFFEDTAHNFIDGGSATGKTLTVEAGKHYLVYCVNTNTSGNAFPSSPSVSSGATVDRVFVNGDTSGVRSRIYIALVTATDTSLVMSNGSGRTCAIQLD